MRKDRCLASTYIYASIFRRLQKDEKSVELTQGFISPDQLVFFSLIHDFALNLN
ncbi:MAG: hypothetical protein ACJAYM_001939 [Flavobacteriales bacterium]|jgi:hypothetical protein